MATIAGPKIQMPLVMVDGAEGVKLTVDGASFLHSLQQTAFALSRSGPTASRPTSAMDGRWIGMPYYDTDLGFQINLHSVTPDIWHDGNGAVV